VKRIDEERLSHHEGPSAATPQPKRKCNFYHEGHEEHEVVGAGFKPALTEPFVSFVSFVVMNVISFLVAALPR
jgi:hypothetical protein